MFTNIRLDPATARALEVIARRRGQTVAEVIETAVSELVARGEVTPYERVEELIGVVSGGPPDLAERAWRPAAKASWMRYSGAIDADLPDASTHVDEVLYGRKRP